MPPASYIRQLFIAILLLVSFGLQHGHGLVHMAEAFHTPHCKHEPTESKQELTHEHDTHESHCGICQFQLSPSFLAAVSQHSFVSGIYNPASRIFFVKTLSDEFNRGIVSDRGPPFALI